MPAGAARPFPAVRASNFLDTDYTDFHGLFMSEFLYREDTHRLIGLCMEIHRELGKGHDEVIYKDAPVYRLPANENSR